MSGDRRQINVQVPARVREALDAFHRAAGGDKQDHVAAAVMAYMGMTTAERDRTFAAYKKWIGVQIPELPDFRSGESEGSSIVERQSPGKSAGTSSHSTAAGSRKSKTG